MHYMHYKDMYCENKNVTQNNIHTHYKNIDNQDKTT